MKIKQLGDLNIDLLEGEYHRFVDDDGTRTNYYLCVGLNGTNKLLFHYIDVDGTPVDYVQTTIDNLPEVALNYLTRVIANNDNLIAHVNYYPGWPTGFDLYYDSNCESNLIDDIVQWEKSHNDFAAKEYSYTEIINGKQRPIGQE